MLPDDTKEEIEEAANRGVLALDAYEQKIKDKFGVSTYVALAVDMFILTAATYVYVNYLGVGILGALVVCLFVFPSAMGIFGKTKRLMEA